jgi:hypothetical protein
VHLADLVGNIGREGSDVIQYKQNTDEASDLPDGHNSHSPNSRDRAL